MAAEGEGVKEAPEVEAGRATRSWRHTRRAPADDLAGASPIKQFPVSPILR